MEEVWLKIGLYVTELVISLILLRALLKWREQEVPFIRVLAFTMTWISLLVLSGLGMSERVWGGLPVLYGWLLLIVPWILVEVFFRTEGEDTFAIAGIWVVGTHIIPWIIFTVLGTIIS